MRGSRSRSSHYRQLPDKSTPGAIRGRKTRGLLGRIKQVPELRRIPVVIISIAPDRNKGFALGAAAVFQKPISRQELYDSLVDLGVFPLSQGQTLKVLVVDDDPRRWT